MSGKESGVMTFISKYTIAIWRSNLTNVLPAQIVSKIDYAYIISFQFWLQFVINKLELILEITQFKRLDIFFNNTIKVNQIGWTVIPMMQLNRCCTNFNPQALNFLHKINVTFKCAIHFLLVTLWLVIVILTPVHNPVTYKQNSLRTMQLYLCEPEISQGVLKSNFPFCLNHRYNSWKSISLIIGNTFFVKLLESIIESFCM